MTNTFIKDPSDVLPFKFDFASETNASDVSAGDWLDSGETLLTKTITTPTGITLDSSAFADTNTSVIIWVSGGTDGTKYTIACKCTTSGLKTVEKSMNIIVSNQ